jgi:hypothetical protein
MDLTTRLLSIAKRQQPATSRPADPLRAEPVIPPRGPVTPSENGRPEIVVAAGWALPVQVGPETINATLWDGRPLRSPVAFDTETAVMTADHEIPRLALAVASDGERHVLVLPGQLRAIIVAHVYTHNLSHKQEFDYKVIARNARLLRVISDSPR